MTRSAAPFAWPTQDHDVDVQTARRRAVSLTPQADVRTVQPARHRRTADSARVHVAPPMDGLSKFDLGSVPASVTPPASWRKAAWFAGLASCAVVVAMLLITSALVGRGPADRRGLDGWPGRSGIAPPISDERGIDRPGVAHLAPATDSSSAPVTDDASSRASSSSEAHGPRSQQQRQQGAANSANSAGSSDPGPDDTTTGPTTTRVPEKPPVTPAPRSTGNRVYLLAEHDPQTMAARSQKFLDTVTENAAQAHQLTTGKLRAQGADSLRRRYSGIAFFEVQHIYVDQGGGYTTNTVRTTFTDGTTRTETRRLTFGDDSKIADDT